MTPTRRCLNPPKHPSSIQKASTALQEPPLAPTLQPPTHYEPQTGVRIFARPRCISPLSWTGNAMASTRIKLDTQTIGAIAHRVVEILEQRGLQNQELVDAAELARRFGIERSWVYSHAIKLGAVKLGNGAKPRLRFDPQIAVRVLRQAGERSAADPPARSGKRAGQPSASGGSGVPLLPIHRRGEKGPPSAA